MLIPQTKRRRAGKRQVTGHRAVDEDVARSSASDSQPVSGRRARAYLIG
jgi:hypothetical protein